MMVSLVCFTGRLPLLYQESPRRSPQKRALCGFGEQARREGHPLLWRGRPRKSTARPGGKNGHACFFLTGSQTS